MAVQCIKAIDGFFILNIFIWAIMPAINLPSPQFNNIFYEFGYENNPTIEQLRSTLIRDAISNQKYTASVRRTFLFKCWNAYFTGKHIKNYKVFEDDKTANILHADSIENISRGAKSDSGKKNGEQSRQDYIEKVVETVQ